ncbi:hypothetical protein AB4225_29345 [Streptomyces sp. 2RAF24]|uniref:hypothetical protein n=1 Tax=Streptomyces sp. 2RAF24 TaxID=3232997 RepID=UPI003F983B7D
MPKNIHFPAAASATSVAPEANRLTLPAVLGVIALPVIAAALAATGMPSSEIVPLLAYSTGIGIAAVLTLSGGRRLIAGLAALVVRATQQ